MQIGIISYLPSEVAIREKRKSFISAQLSWLRGIFPMTKPITVVAQGYNEEDYHHDFGEMEYIESNPVGPAEARNILLRKFYKTDDDYFLLLDDDFALYDYYDGDNLLREIESNPKKFIGLLDMIVGNNPVYLPFKKKNWADRKNISLYWKFKRTQINSGMPIAVVKNAAKYFEKMYFFNQGVQFHEDIDFTIQWVMGGHNRYQCEQWQYRDLGHTASTIFTKERKEEKQWFYNTISSYPSSWGLIKPIPGGGVKMDFTYINKRNVSLQTGYIKREKPFEFTEKEMPKE